MLERGPARAKPTAGKKEGKEGKPFLRRQAEAAEALDRSLGSEYRIPTRSSSLLGRKALAYELITYAFRESDISDVGELKEAVVERLLSECSTALREAFPGTEVEVSVREEVSESDVMKFSPEVSNEDKELAERVVEEAYAKWSDSLCDEDMSPTLQ